MSEGVSIGVNLAWSSGVLSKDGWTKARNLALIPDCSYLSAGPGFLLVSPVPVPTSYASPSTDGWCPGPSLSVLLSSSRPPLSGLLISGTH